MNTANRQRADMVLELICAGLSHRQITDQIAKKHPEWALSRRTLDRLIFAARDTLAEEAAPRRAVELAKAIRRLDMLYSRSLIIQDYKTCLAVERERIALLNLSHTWPLIRPVVATAQALQPIAPPIRRAQEVAAHA